MSSRIAGDNEVVVVSCGCFVSVVLGCEGIGSVVAGTPKRWKGHEIARDEMVVASAPSRGKRSVPIFNQDQGLTKIVYHGNKQE